METDNVFRPKTREEDNFAVGVPTNGPVCLIESYPDMQKLEVGYRVWLEHSRQAGITKPVPLQRIRGSAYRIIREIMPKEDPN